MTHPKSHVRLARVMQTLRPGDVLTNLACHVHQHHQVLVLNKKGSWLDLSIKAEPGHISITLDENGPWRWDDQQATLLNKEGRPYGHIAPGIEVHEAAGLEQLGWYRSLPRSDEDHWHISTENPLGTVGDPATVAKIEAHVARMFSGDSPQQMVRSISHLIELAFAGQEHLLDNRRMRLLHAGIVSVMAHVVKLNLGQQLRRDPREELVAGMMAAMMGGRDDDLSENAFAAQLFGGMGLERRPRRERRESHEGNRSTERTPHHRGNGADHSAYEHHGFPG